MRRAKIICTLGPATDSYEEVLELVEAGMDVARLNFSHGTHEEHERRYHWVRRASDESGRSVGVLADLQGPKMRLGLVEGGHTYLAHGAPVTLSTEEFEGTAERLSVSYEKLASDVDIGDVILIDDGLVHLIVEDVDGTEVRCRVVEGGVVSDHKGLNLPGSAVSAPALTEKDTEDLRFALGLRVDMVALSFVRSPADVDGVRAVMAEVGARLPVIAKVERPEAVEHIAEVVAAFDAIMVARGDLGVELPLERVPEVQRRAIRLARRSSKPVIVATQMLDSMVRNVRPTRAEVSDVANAVLDGADAVMLSAETSVGAHPARTVAIMARILAVTEADAADRPTDTPPPSTRSRAIAHAAVDIVTWLPVTAIAAFTMSGDTVRMLASHRPALPILAFTPDPAVRSQLAVVWGVETFVVPQVASTDEMVLQVEHALLALGRAVRDDLVAIVAGSPPGRSGSINILRLHRVGELDPG